MRVRCETASGAVVRPLLRAARDCAARPARVLRWPATRLERVVRAVGVCVECWALSRVERGASSRDVRDVRGVRAFDPRAVRVRLS